MRISSRIFSGLEQTMKLGNGDNEQRNTPDFRSFLIKLEIIFNLILRPKVSKFTSIAWVAEIIDYDRHTYRRTDSRFSQHECGIFTIFIRNPISNGVGFPSFSLSLP